MKKSLVVLGLHYRETKNIGDRNCHPLDYLDIKSLNHKVSVIKCDVRNIPDDVNPDIVVFGGGAIANHADKIRKRFPDSFKVAWGIGFTTNKKEALPENVHEKFSEDFHVYGSRDYNTNTLYTPCASCLSELFDEQYPKTSKVAVYGHAGKLPLREEADSYGFQYMDNTQHKHGLKGIIQHLGTADIVVTNSYHGAYWSSLLDVRVSMIPFGSKFFNLKYIPAYSDSFEMALAKAENNVGLKEKYREHVWEFAKHVSEECSSFFDDQIWFEKKSAETIM